MRLTLRHEHLIPQDLENDSSSLRGLNKVSGEQFAFPEIVEALRKIRQQPTTGELISTSAADPFNLLGIILPGKKISNLTSNRIVFRDGIPFAVWESKKVKFLQELDPAEQWTVQKVLIQRRFPAKLRYYLGKNYG